MRQVREMAAAQRASGNSAAVFVPSSWPGLPQRQPELLPNPAPRQISSTHISATLRVSGHQVLSGLLLPDCAS